MANTPEPGLLAYFLRHQNDLLQFLAYKVRCAETAADLVQETYLRIARHGDSGEIANQQAFVFRVADNLALDHLRARTRHELRYAGTVAEDIVSSIPEPDTVLADRQQLERLEKLIQQLPANRRRVFLLCRVEGKSYAEVAHELDITPRTVENHVYKALKTLKERFEDPE